MDNKMAVFNNCEFGSIRVIEQNGKYLFCGSDVAKALGYSNPRKAVRDHTRGGTKCSIPTTSGDQTMAFIPEGSFGMILISEVADAPVITGISKPADLKSTM